MKAIYFSFFILLFAIGCSKKNDNNAMPTTADLFPDKVGDTWLYLVNDTVLTLQNVTTHEYNMTVTVTGSLQLPGGIMANVWVYSYPGGADTNYVYKTGDTVLFLSKPYYAGAYQKVKQYIIPLSLNSQWQYEPAFTNAPPYVKVDMQDNIITGGNSFPNAFRIAGQAGHPDSFFYIEEWNKDHIGIVKRYFNNFHLTTNPVQHTTQWSLLSYHLN